MLDRIRDAIDDCYNFEYGKFGWGNPMRLLQFHKHSRQRSEPHSEGVVEHGTGGASSLYTRRPAPVSDSEAGHGQFSPSYSPTGRLPAAPEPKYLSPLAPAFKDGEKFTLVVGGGRGYGKTQSMAQAMDYSNIDHRLLLVHGDAGPPANKATKAARHHRMWRP